MIPEIGQFALILALFVAVAQAIFPIWGAARGIPSWIALARPAAFTQLGLVALSYGCLTWTFVTSDFSVLYAATNSNTALPMIYKISGVWGAHEGSLLLWILILNIWTAAVALFSRGVPAQVVARVLSVMAMIAIGFMLFTLLTSNPFERLLVPPPEGRDLNPLLQDIGLAIHPPMLYIGYVGFSVAFAFAIAAMLGGRLDAAWARWARPWTTSAWLFLTMGIALGSWWAYYELGWGGWWFWDPVENASFMPWLVGTGLIHSLAVTEKRGVFKAWTVLLAILAFSLSLLGTFLVRSGVLTSVHAFASDPERGVFVLMFLCVVVGGSLALYAWRAPLLRSTGRFELMSKETLLLVNNVLLVIACFTVLLGTLYPLVLDAMDAGKISVGPPYFNKVFLPVTAPLAVLMVFGVLANWRQANFFAIARRLVIPAILSVVMAVVYPTFVMGYFSIAAFIGVLLATWVMSGAVYALWARVEKKSNKLKALRNTPAGFWGMTLAHLGIGVFIAGITLTSVYSIEKDMRIVTGDVYEMGGYKFRFEGVQKHDGPNYQANRGLVIVSKGGDEVAHLEPEKRTYLVQKNPMTEAAIDAGLFRDLYVALGEPVGDGAWAVRVYYKPFVRWIWLGAIFMAIGGVFAASDKRYRLASRMRKTSSAAVPAASAGRTAGA